MKTIILNGNNLTKQEVTDIAYNRRKVRIDTKNLKTGLDYIEEAVAGNKIIYGVTTGFGSNADIKINSKDAARLQINLLRSHACGVGDNFPAEIVRAIMAIRLNTLLRGHSGIRESTVKQLEFMLNHEIHPVIPEQGSVGASGDLCPLSHMALPLIGEGEIEYDGKEYLTKDFLHTEEAKKIGFEPVELSYKEGLALTNGTAVMTAVGTIALHKAEQLLEVCTLSSALIFESLCARKESFGYAKIHEARNHSGQSDIAAWLVKLLQGSKLIGLNQNDILKRLLTTDLIPDCISAELRELSLKNTDEQEQIPDSIIEKTKAAGKPDVATILSFAKKKWKPQDSYSVRCLPQVFGASKTAVDHVLSVVSNELNASVDNPLIFAEDRKAVSGGNFHGQPIALTMDYLKLAIAEIGNITERQINKMIDANANDCLESFLIHGTGPNNGLMIPQYVAAALVSENKVLVHPASADSIPTCQNTEDHVSMGTVAARQALQIADNVSKIAAIAVMTGFYAISMRLEQFAKVGMECEPEQVLSPATFEFYTFIRESDKEFQNIDFLKNDIYLHPKIKSISKNFENFATIAEKYIR